MKWGRDEENREKEQGGGVEDGEERIHVLPHPSPWSLFFRKTRSCKGPRWIKAANVVSTIDLISQKTCKDCNARRLHQRESSILHTTSVENRVSCIYDRYKIATSVCYSVSHCKYHEYKRYRILYPFMLAVLLHIFYRMTQQDKVKQRKERN